MNEKETGPTLKQGCSGPWVKELQNNLNMTRTSSLLVDGEFEKETREAVIKFQSENNLVTDGIVGLKTWDNLFNTRGISRPKYLTYIVKQGDNLYQLAKKYKTKVEDLMKLNNLTNDHIIVDQQLLVPARNTEPEELNKILKFGDKGELVKRLQTKLNEIGFNVGKVDGNFGNNTLGAVQGFQKDYSLKVDGIVGVKTWEVLEQD